ncbi:MAG: dUTP diphosphatase [Phycisphaeraceae bacterium]|nr:MAG: dUTP diphosphatase [Phycisphaeraceae bacterium]
MYRPTMRVFKLRPEAIVPRYHSEHAAGLDLAACPADGRPVEIPPGAIRMIPLGLVLAIPVGYEGQVRPRSGLATRHGVTLPNSPGTIDADYRGEAMVPLINHGKEPFTVDPGMRVAQLVIAPVAHASVEEAESMEDLGATERAAQGFGSTGLR